jgi:D-xylose transport system ATP-binding protein
VLWNSKLVILDEPTAALGVAQTEQVLRLVRRLADNGLAVILISHNMNDVLAVADDIAVLYLGRMTAQVEAKDVNHSEIVKLITGGAMVVEGGRAKVVDAHEKTANPVVAPAADEDGATP